MVVELKEISLNDLLKGSHNRYPTRGMFCVTAVSKQNGFSWVGSTPVMDPDEIRSNFRKGKDGGSFLFSPIAPAM